MISDSFCVVNRPPCLTQEFPRNVFGASRRSLHIIAAEQSTQSPKTIESPEDHGRPALLLGLPAPMVAAESPGRVRKQGTERLHYRPEIAGMTPSFPLRGRWAARADLGPAVVMSDGPEPVMGKRSPPGQPHASFSSITEIVEFATKQIGIARLFKPRANPGNQRTERIHDAPVTRSEDAGKECLRVTQGT